MNYLSNRVLFFIFHYESDREKKKRIKEGHFCPSIPLDISRTFNMRYTCVLFYQTFVSIIRASVIYKKQQE